MSVKITTEYTGQTEIHPRFVKVDTTNTYAEVSTAGFLNSSTALGYTFDNDDIFFVILQDGTTRMMSASISAGVITLIPSTAILAGSLTATHIPYINSTGAMSDSGIAYSSIIPSAVSITANDIPYVNGDGKFADSGIVYSTVAVKAAAITANNIPYINADGKLADSSIVYTTVATKASAITANNVPYVNGGGALADSLIAYTTIATKASAITANNIPYVDADGKLADSLIAYTNVLKSSLTNPDLNANLVAFNVTCGFAALATAGSVTLYASSGSKQYRIIQLYLNTGTNFSGGGGDRLGQVTDATTVYSVVPAATMQTLVNSAWGTTDLPLPASAAVGTITAAGANLVFKYSGGATDYTAGSLSITGLLQRVA